MFFSQLPLNPSQQFQMLQTLKQRGIITAEQARNPGAIQVVSSKGEGGLNTYTISDGKGSAYMELTDLGKGKFSTFQFEHAEHSVKAVISGNAGLQFKTPGEDGETYGGKAGGQLDLVKGTATGGASANIGDFKAEKGGSIDKDGNITTGKGGSYDGSIKDIPINKGTNKQDPILGFEGQGQGGYTAQTDKASFGVLQPSGSLTEVQVQRDFGLVEGEAGARLKLDDVKKLIKNLENGDIKKAADVAKSGGGASGQLCVVKATDTISHRNAPEIDENGNAIISTIKGEANVCGGGALELKMGSGKLTGKVGPLGAGLASETETGEVTDAQRAYIDANEQGALSDTGDFLDSVKDLAIDGGANAVTGLGLDKALDWAKQTAGDLWGGAKDLWNDTFGDNPPGEAPPPLSSPLPNSLGSRGGGQSIKALEDEADDLSGQAEERADDAESAARHARSAARRAASIAARIRAMTSRR